MINIIGVLGLILIVKEMGVLWFVKIVKSLFSLFNTLKSNLTIKGILIKFIKDFVCENYRTILIIAISFIGVCIVMYFIANGCVVIKERVKKRQYNKENFYGKK